MSPKSNRYHDSHPNSSTPPSPSPQQQPLRMGPSSSHFGCFSAPRLLFSSDQQLSILPSQNRTRNQVPNGPRPFKIPSPQCTKTSNKQPINKIVEKQEHAGNFQKQFVKTQDCSIMKSKASQMQCRQNNAGNIERQKRKKQKKQNRGTACVLSTNAASNFKLPCYRSQKGMEECRLGLDATELRL